MFVWNGSWVLEGSLCTKAMQKTNINNLRLWDCLSVNQDTQMACCRHSVVAESIRTEPLNLVTKIGLSVLALHNHSRTNWVSLWCKLRRYWRCKRCERREHLNINKKQKDAERFSNLSSYSTLAKMLLSLNKQDIMTVRKTVSGSPSYMRKTE